MKRVVKNIFITFLAAGILLTVIVAGKCGWISVQSYPDSPSWKNITPGKTSLDEIVSMYGNPDEIKHGNGITNLIYRNHSSFKPRTRVDIIIAKKNSSYVVKAVFGDSLFWGFPQERYIPSNDFVNLEQIIIRYGKPSKVTWAPQNLMRYLMWPEQGIAVIAEPKYKPTLTWREIEVNGIIVFEPMNLNRYICSTYHWASVSNFIFPSFKMPPQIPDMRDIFPEDPYDWDNIPAPSSTKTP